MLASFRRLSTSKVGTGIMVVILLLILVGFAVGDIQSVIRGGGFGASADTMAKVGSLKVWIGDSLSQETPLYTAEAVGVGPLHSRALDAIGELLVGWMR